VGTHVGHGRSLGGGRAGRRRCGRLRWLEEHRPACHDGRPIACGPSYTFPWVRGMRKDYRTDGWTLDGLLAGDDCWDAVLVGLVLKPPTDAFDSPNHRRLRRARWFRGPFSWTPPPAAGILGGLIDTTTPPTTPFLRQLLAVVSCHASGRFRYQFRVSHSRRRTPF